MVQRKPSPMSVEQDIADYPVTLARATPLPILRIMPLLLQRAAEGMTFTIIFPYVNDMLLSFGVEERELGFYAGLVVGAGRNPAESRNLP